jgi:type III restriction enzyme
MLTEGWDANNVTHILGIRAFGTQLLCEQVIGRALRRQSYDLNEEELFNAEYADVFGIPFDFTAKPVIAPPQPPRETVQVRAVRPERDDLEIRFPRVEGYRVELPEERLTASFNDDSILELTPDLVGPSITRNAGIIGEGVDMNLEHLDDMRPSTLLFHITQRLLYTKWRDPGEQPKLHLFGQLKRVTKQWLDTCLVCKGGTYPALLMYQELADVACNRITAGITHALEANAQLRSYSILTTPPAPRHMSASPLPKPSAGTPVARLRRTTSTGLSSTAIGRPSSAVWPKRTPRSPPTPRTTTSASKCPTVMAPRPANTYPTSLC